ncbi:MULTISPECIES: hypothetical protein [Bradyrhizobium]
MSTYRLRRHFKLFEGSVIEIDIWHETLRFSLPSIIGRDGVVEVLEPDLSDQERQKLDESANHLRQALARLQRT